jgi:hypothetical protein
LVRLLLSLWARPQAHTEGQAGALTPAMLAAALEKKELIPLLSQHSLVRLNPRQLDISSILRDVARAGASLPAV